MLSLLVDVCSCYMVFAFVSFFYLFLLCFVVSLICLFVYVCLFSFPTSSLSDLDIVYSISWCPQASANTIQSTVLFFIIIVGNDDDDDDDDEVAIIVECCCCCCCCCF